MSTAAKLKFEIGNAALKHLPMMNETEQKQRQQDSERETKKTKKKIQSTQSM